ncbi:DUF397 domain-containing protein [Streptomyces cacaoi]|uniref:DUF397 domain-containing protein n=1 Tax=Streptomyces cacaoi TaxID=1898 RepID=UPI003144EC44
MAPTGPSDRHDVPRALPRPARPGPGRHRTRVEAAIDTKTPAAEVAEEYAWFKSSYSNDTGGNCVEETARFARTGSRGSEPLVRHAARPGR